MYPDRNPVLRLLRRWMPVTDRYENGKFLMKVAGQTFATPLFVALLIVETTDLIFAIDSVPAILAITLDPFIVYTSNVFAILGLRTRYFVMAAFMRSFTYLHYGLSAILVFVGAKMLLADIHKTPVTIALDIIASILLISAVASILWAPKEASQVTAPTDSSKREDGM